MKFVKFHGYGNDYVVCDAAELAGLADVPEFVRRVCDRHYGVGADGIATLERYDGGGGEGGGKGESTAADFVLRIFNPDGSEAAMSGNGSRSAASFLYFQNLWQREELRLATKAGVKLYRLLERDARGRFRFAAEIGRPAFDSATIPMLTGDDAAREQVVNFPLELETGETVRLTALQMCNPNACVFVDDFANTDWRRLGREIESHPQFPQRTNVEFVRVRDRASVEVRVYERGVGPTLSSGTGACAAAVAACINNLTERRVRVEMEGGRLEVEWRDDGEVLLTGEAEVVYRGEWLRGK